jgi:sulfite oxidase
MHRRKFLTQSTQLSLAVLFSNAFMTIPLQASQEKIPKILKDKLGLALHNTRPLNAETIVTYLDDTVTPKENLFIRNNGLMPDLVDVKTWRLHIDGESVIKPLSFSMGELKSLFKEVSYHAILECGGNGRAEFYPTAKGNQWGIGAVGCLKWTGVRLADVLKHCGVADDAVYVAYHSSDKFLSGDTTKEPISRGCPIGKALQDECILAYKMNDEDIPFLHGFPMRLIVPGYPGSASGKWIHTISIRNKVHDGRKMNGYAYRIPCNPVEAGSYVAEKDMCIIEEMPVKSLMFHPPSRSNQPINKPLTLKGHAWTGLGIVKAVYISYNYGVTWKKATMTQAHNKYAWNGFSHTISFDKAGYYEIWAKAEDSHGNSQPVIMPGWNPKGYLNNACHRLAVNVYV